MSVNLVRFNMSVGRQKPENIVRKENICPFCHPESLSGIIASDEGGILLLENKYQVLDGADQLVLVETGTCGPDMPDYPREHMRRLIRFGVGHWRRMEESGKYSATIFFKNHGHMSGGTMRHAHMQLVGFRRGVAPELFAASESFDGIAAAARDGVEVNAALSPRLGFGEFNIVAEKGASLDTLADFIQTTVSFIRARYTKSGDSYNIFFYRVGKRICVKLMPRFATSPLFIGYDIRVLPSDMPNLASELGKLFSEKALLK